MRVSPELTEDELQKTVVEARKLIINLYLTCEQDFDTGVSIYKAIVDQLSLDTTQRQNETLERQINEVVVPNKDNIISKDE